MSKEIFAEYNEILSIEDVMEILHIGKNSVYSLLKSNEIRNIRVGKRYIVPKQSVINFITAITENKITNLKKGQRIGRKLNNKRQLLLCQISSERQTENDCDEDTR